MLASENLDQLAQHFALTISEQVVGELQQIVALLLLLENDMPTRSQLDRWSFTSGNGAYSSMAFYNLMFDGLDVSPIFKKLRKSKYLHKQKVFMWLLLVDRLNTGDMMDRRQWHVQSGLNCVMCNAQDRET